jgi:hypothetical protein
LELNVEELAIRLYEEKKNLQYIQKKIIDLEQELEAFRDYIGTIECITDVMIEKLGLQDNPYITGEKEKGETTDELPF